MGCTSELVFRKTVRCIQVGQPPGTVCDKRSKPTNRDRIVAQCFVDNHDIAEPMVKGGYACDWVKFSGGHYSHHPAGRFVPAGDTRRQISSAQVRMRQLGNG